MVTNAIALVISGRFAVLLISPLSSPSGGSVAALPHFRLRCMLHSSCSIAGANNVANAVCYLGTPQTPYGCQGVKCTASGYFYIVANAVFLFCPPCPYVFPMPLLFKTVLFLLLGAFSRGSFFFLCRFWSFSCCCSFPSGCRFGVVQWLLFVVVASFVSFVLWLGGVVLLCLSFCCCVVCVFVFSVGRVFRGGASWGLFCFWFGVGCLCPCRGLSRFLSGACPPFFMRSLSFKSHVQDYLFFWAFLHSQGGLGLPFQIPKLSERAIS